MGKLKYLVVHCTDTPPTMSVTKEILTLWHMGAKPEGRGWDRLGYSDIIHRNGVLENLTPYNDDDIIDSKEMTWGATGINAISRHVVLEGGWKNKTEKTGTFEPTEIFTHEQLEALKRYLQEQKNRYPNIEIIGHRDVPKSGKTCPNFDVKKWVNNYIL